MMERRNLRSPTQSRGSGARRPKSHECGPLSKNGPESSETVVWELLNRKLLRFSSLEEKCNG